MKAPNFTLVFFFMLCMFCSGNLLRAQTLWSACYNGGANGMGTLVKINTDGSNPIKVYDFVDSTGSNPMGSVLQASNHIIYGTCFNGGTYASCCLYGYDPTAAVYSDLWNFDITHGDYPMSGVVQVSDSVLIGAASAGGNASAGVIYSFNMVTDTYTEVYDLDSTGQFAPIGSPILGSDGFLYGLTSSSGVYYSSVTGAGGIYKFDWRNGIYTALYNFAGATDGYPYGSLSEHNGVLYGMSSGTQYCPAYQLIYGLPDSSIPPAFNYGNIFSYNLSTQQYSSLYTFDSVNGKAPFGSLLWASNGKFYGLTSAGGANNSGVLFSFDLSTSTYSKLYDFDSSTGSVPTGDLMQSTDGNLYGTTMFGGTPLGAGVVFSFDPINNNYAVVNNLDNVTNGMNPCGGAPALIGNKATGILAPTVNPLEAYPVPTLDRITVNMPADIGETPVLSLTDLNGRTVWGPRPEPVNNSLIQLDLSQLESGVYFLQASTSNTVLTKKIIKE